MYLLAQTAIIIGRIEACEVAINQDGVKGKGVVAECNSILKQASDNMNYTIQTMGNGALSVAFYKK